MARDVNLQETIESVLYGIGGIPNTGRVAGIVWDAIREQQEDFVATEVVLRDEIRRLQTELARVQSK